MKAFISYSINDNDQVILTLLSSKLREKNFIVNTSQNFYSRSLDYITQKEIGESLLFIGIITGQGLERTRVLDEWQYAQTRKTPTLLLIEDTVNVSQSFPGTYIRFNRFNPQSAVDVIHRRMTELPTSKTNSDDIVPWILGGAALLAILALFSSNRE